MAKYLYPPWIYCFFGEDILTWPEKYILLGQVSISSPKSKCQAQKKRSGAITAPPPPSLIANGMNVQGESYK